MARHGTPGTRVFGGRHYLLTGRGKRIEMDRSAARWRTLGYFARVVAWNPFYRAELRKTLDDYAVFTFPREG